MCFYQHCLSRRESAYVVEGSTAWVNEKVIMLALEKITLKATHEGESKIKYPNVTTPLDTEAYI